MAESVAGLASEAARPARGRRGELIALKSARGVDSTVALVRSLRGGPPLLSAAAHELRTPITALVMSSELLAEDTEGLDAAQIRSIASGIHRQVLWLHGLVENLLCAGDLGEGSLELHPRPVMLGEVLREIGPVVEPLLAQKGQRLRLSTGRANREVAVDWRRIGQVLVNLVTNAGKYAGRDTTIDVSCSVRGDAARVMVADRGPGLPADRGGCLFEPYYRGAEDARSGKEGLGLGLAIVKAIVEAHGGRVGAANRRGGGACFWLELPVLANPASEVRRRER